jgi:hypothetical protein
VTLLVNPKSGDQCLKISCFFAFSGEYLPAFQLGIARKSLSLGSLPAVYSDRNLQTRESLRSCGVVRRRAHDVSKVAMSQNLSPVRVKGKPYFKQSELKKRVNLPAVLPSRPIDIEATDHIMTTKAQQRENKSTPDTGSQTKTVEKDSLDDFFLP